MKPAALALYLAVIAPASAAGQSAAPLREVRFSGPSAMEELCACLLDMRRSAEAQGRLDFTAEVESAGTGGSLDLTARIWMGSAHAVGRINFTGHSGINDSTLRRAMTIYERDLLDVGQLRRSLARINDIGVFEPLTLADISVARRDDGVTADLTIPLRERKRRWWSYRVRCSQPSARCRPQFRRAFHHGDAASLKRPRISSRSTWPDSRSRSWRSSGP